MNFTMHLCAHINVNFKGKSTLKPALAEKPGVTLQNLVTMCVVVCVCVLMLYVPVNNISVNSGVHQ